MESENYLMLFYITVTLNAVLLIQFLWTNCKHGVYFFSGVVVAFGTTVLELSGSIPWSDQLLV